MAQLKDDLGNAQNNLSSQYQKYLDAVKNNLSQMPQTQQAISNSSNDVKNQFGQNINPIGIGLGAQVGMQLKPQQQDNTIPKQNDPIIQQPTQIPQQNTQQPTQTVTTQSQQPQFDVAAYINRLAEAKKTQQLNNLQNAYNNNISALDIQKAGIEPKYYDKRNQESVSSQLQAKNFAEYMANRGLTNSGSNAQAELMRNMSLQGNIGSLNRQELQDLNNIETQRTNLTNAYNNDVASSNAGIDAQAMQDLITQYNNDRNRQDQLDQFAKQYGLSMAGLTGSINGQDTMQKTQQDFENYMSKLGYDKSVADTAWNQQMQERQFNWETDTTNNPTLAKAKLDYETAMKTQPYEIKLIQSQVQQASDENTLNALKVQAQRMENQLSSINLKYAPQQAQQQLNQAKAQVANIYNEISNRAAQLGISRDELKERKREFDVTQSNKANPSSKPMTQAQIGNAKTAIAKELEAINMKSPTKEEVDTVFAERYGTPTVTQTNTKSDYTKVDGYNDDLSYAQNNGSSAVAEIKANQSALTKKYGSDGYNALLKAAGGGK